MDPDDPLWQARNPQTTPFDYVIVGSGAGGGPLAARLALNGRRVLLIEAGNDPAVAQPDARAQPMTRGAPDLAQQQMRQVYAVPAFHASATEDPDMSWEFSVRHYTSTARQQADPKYDGAKDPSAATDGQGQGGIFYPRAAAIGGCTSHHAMIIIRPNDADWDRIAEYTGDDSWRSQNMQGYFAKIENCLYYSVYRTFAGKTLGLLFRFLEWTARKLDPRGQIDPGGHGSAGWQKTSFIDPFVIAAIVRGDRTFVGVLKDVLFASLANRNAASMFGRALARFQILQFLDPNVRSPDIQSRAHVSLISIGTDGKRRCGLRDHLLNVMAEFPDRLVILNPAHATRIVFERSESGVPRAIGVEVRIGPYLYAASPKYAGKDGTPVTQQVFARREVIVCGGAFNTPQLLMLSGIGDSENLKGKVDGPRDRDGALVGPVVHLPGVGRNLQDRYEVSVISEASEPFSTLDGVTFDPGDAKDPMLLQWLADQTGLYSTNGGALAMMMSSANGACLRSDPDLFIFGLPVAFRGYYWDYSQQLLCRSMTSSERTRNLWSWVILKAYTNNNNGTVRLLSGDPFQMPEINFHSFDDTSEGAQDCTSDVDSLCDAIKRIREINGHVSAFSCEVQPGVDKPDCSPTLRQWIKDEAWGHHACGTCRIGYDPWCKNPRDLQDRYAVVDSKFRVHGVEGLRIVDTSVFPTIPGYFIVTPTFMISEKAADVLLADSENYPRELESVEAKAVRERRDSARPAWEEAANADRARLPGDTVGLALSGGGVRSATFCLGVLQALASRRRLRDIDFMSSVSGGGYIASFLGKLFTEMPDQDRQIPADRVERTLTNLGSSTIQWLRYNAQYLVGGGRHDVLFDIVVILRNLAAVHVWIGALLFGVLGTLHWFALDCSKVSVVSLVCESAPPQWYGVTLSAWWRLPLWFVVIGMLPPSIGYWLTMRRRPKWDWRLWLPFAVWLVMIGCAIYGLTLPDIGGWSALALGVLLLAWFEQQAAGLFVAKPVSSGASAPPLDPGTAQPEGGTIVIRNRLTRLLGVALFGFVVTALFVVVDTLAQFLPACKFRAMTWSLAGVAPVLVLLRGIAASVLKRQAKTATTPAPEAGKTLGSGLVKEVLLALFAFALAFVLFLFLDVLVYLVFGLDPTTARYCVIAALLISAVKGRVLLFLNLSSLQQSYAQKLVRTYLGASNDARVNPPGTSKPVPVGVSDLGDDVMFDDYHPERHGGPLHLVCSCLNNTVDPLSGNQLRDDKGMPMCVGPAGISAGRRFHALWGARDATTSVRFAPVTAVRVEPDPNAFHAFVKSSGAQVDVERLSLGQWMAISGAAASTGLGRNTKLAESLLLGLLNVRIGYWWNSGIPAGGRPGQYRRGGWRVIKSLPSIIFTLQAKLLDEWRAYFEGPSAKLWYLSDGGHFDNTGIYELIRRRLPFIVAVDAAADPDYRCESLALLTRQVRYDFCATITWIDPAAVRAKLPRRRFGWSAFDRAPHEPKLPDWIKPLLDPEAIGTFSELQRDGSRGAALACITYSNQPDRPSWMLYVKPSVGIGTPTDVSTYAENYRDFPQQTTADQFFSDSQWEAYRELGYSTGMSVFTAHP
ncbi:GMC family oxidoreductase N-terminal domain-containing protein [Paraburkholderia sp. CNPSo 3076]|uniref:GMC oxidoreductase n=1 Tax=Paraburkholderia sp. CNPSo 3076 TaxID=2940936 RepID=UPI0022525EB2|nr:GMC oxidoreductase [Paraburkholderia sp. CNPSo 3076]MCX5540002.1 GMC family oxidoreductase N-terminal domain-containing protein [Paraburkholderia sp. CNPSo 3076]